MNSGGINVVGGEPTLNKSLLPILKLLLTAGLEVRIFTSGKLSANLMASLQVIQEGSFSFCLNRSTEPLAPETILLYHKMGHKVYLSATVFQIDQSLHHIFDEITTYHLEKQYRLGIALPVWPDRRNTHVNPSDYPLLSARLFTVIQSGIDLGIKPFFDCGIPYCFFDAEQKEYFRNNGIDFLSHCGTIPDVCPDSSAIPCFPLAKFGVPVTHHTRWNELKAALEGRTKRQREGGIFPQCADCSEMQEGKCSGGCAALKNVS
jgi:hypothetical protein